MQIIFQIFSFSLFIIHFSFSSAYIRSAAANEKLTMINKKLYALNPLFFEESKKQFVIGHARGVDWLHVSFSAVYYDLLDYIWRELSN